MKTSGHVYLTHVSRGLTLSSYITVHNLYHNALRGSQLHQSLCTASTEGVNCKKKNEKKKREINIKK